MADILFEVVQGGSLSRQAKKLMLTKPLRDCNLNLVDYLVFSGGVSEYIYGHSQVPYGDVGPIFGGKIRARISKLPKKDFLQEPAEGIRATVIGAGEYTLQVSSNTTYISGTSSLPAFGLKAVRCLISKEHSAEMVRDALGEALGKFDLPGFTEGVAFSLSLNGQPDYPYLRRVAEALSAIIRQSDNQGTPLFVVLNLDVAKALGGILKKS